ncbi:MAG TPA: DUF2269 domain-containing protein [Candidatus Thermoplasmatota archaeon]|nr:DUF2269 domain-containing protein [Candidatus Thermoplasmatota archaeon]
MRAPCARILLASHIASSVGWLGALLAFTVLDVATATSRDVATLVAAYLAMDLVARWAIVPLAALALASGVAVALTTRWGLLRHYWVLLSLVLTAFAFAVLLLQLPVVARNAALAREAAASGSGLAAPGNLLLHSVGGCLLLGFVLVLNVVKPRGLTRRGWRLRHEA